MNRGFSLRNESITAGRMISGFQRFFDFNMDTFSSTYEKRVPCWSSRCSRMGPRLSAGKNVSAPRMRTTPVNRIVKRAVLTGNVPGEGGTLLLPARLPARANIGIIIRNRPTNIVSPVVRLYQFVFALRPPNADPLFPAEETKA